LLRVFGLGSAFAQIAPVGFFAITFSQSLQPTCACLSDVEAMACPLGFEFEFESHAPARCFSTPPSCDTPSSSTNHAAFKAWKFVAAKQSVCVGGWVSSLQKQTMQLGGGSVVLPPIFRLLLLTLPPPPPFLPLAQPCQVSTKVSRPSPGK
jgi:hypothetical protein